MTIRFDRSNEYQERPSKWDTLHPDFALYTNVDIAEEAGVFELSRFVAAGAYAFIPASSDVANSLNASFSLLDSIHENKLRFIFFRAFSSVMSEDVRVEFGCFVPCESLKEEEFRQQILNLMKSHGQPVVIYSDGANVGALSSDNKLGIKGSASQFDAHLLRNYWSEIRAKKFFLVETYTCAGGVWSQVSRSANGIINGTKLGTESRQRLSARMSSYFQKAKSGEQLKIDGVIYQCLGNRLWQVDSEEPFIPTGILFHRMNLAYSKSATTV